MRNYEIARRLKGHRATHPMAKVSQLENLVEWVLKYHYQGEDMNPSVGRIVHFQRRNLGLDVGDENQVFPEAALIVHVFDSNDFVSLQVFTKEGGTEFFPAVRFEAEPGEPNTWTWPPRV